MNDTNFQAHTTYSLTHRRHSGFTLIELLVVIAIIGILSSVVLASLNTARAKARDTRRVADISQIALALELYYDTVGNYPCSTGQTSTDANFLQPLIAGGYLGTNPRDPTNTPTYRYFYQTFTQTATCGQYVQINYDRETISTPCILGGKFIRGGVTVPQSDPLATHCHTFIPTPLPCSDPYLTTEPATADCDPPDLLSP